MKIEWFDAAEAVRFGESLGDFFIERIPLASSEAGKSRKLDKQLGVVDKMLVQIEQFKARHKLNVYKKAKLAGAFKEKLIGAGYDSKLVDEVTLGIAKML
ncbi:MAG TPA: hypothetical protein VJQ51_02365 [Burkholderiales bacterium]|nr:hypothetical protein [Burkholderiales bacterium]